MSEVDLSQQLPRLSTQGGQGVNSESNLEASAVPSGRLKAPFPYFGGKSRVAGIVWQRLGDVDNYCEPFCGSAAVLLARPTAPRIETINDADAFVANFWRATERDPGAVATYADGPVNEADLHARHRWLVLSDDAKSFREKMRTDPEFYDPKVAGWWCWGACCWIGSGWCAAAELREDGTPREKMPKPSPDCGGVHFIPEKRPILAAPENKSGRRSHHGIGVHAKGDPSEKLPRLTGGHKGDLYYGGLGVHAEAPEPAVHEKRPVLGIPRGRGDGGSPGRGVHGAGPSDGNSAGTCADRREWLIGWFQRLRDRLRTVRVCCGDWRRVCDSHSVTTRLGLTGIFFDPPYSAEADRCNTLYGVESKTVAHDVRAYCLERGGDPKMRIVLAGYAGEGHEELEASGWTVEAWKAVGGYGNRSDKGRENAARERLWFSPHCVDPAAEAMPLFALLGPDEDLS